MPCEVPSAPVESSGRGYGSFYVDSLYDGTHFIDKVDGDGKYHAGG